MLKRTLFLFSFWALTFSLPGVHLGTAAYGQNRASSGEGIFENYKHLTLKQLFDTANYYFTNQDIDTALIYYNLCTNTSAMSVGSEEQDIIIKSYNNAAYIYYYLCNYRASFESLTKALLLSEKLNHTLHKSKIYSNMGNIYTYFKEYDMAKLYYLKALSVCTDTASMIIIYNNLGSLHTEQGKDSVFTFLNKALELNKERNTSTLANILSNVAFYYQEDKKYDSAFYYYRLSLNIIGKEEDDALEIVKNELQAECLSSLGKLFFEVKKVDSALFYLNLSNTMAVKHNFKRILFENYLTLSQIEESKGNMLKAFEYFKIYSNLKDSVYNAKNLSDIMQLQKLYEVSKANQQIEELVMEQQIKEHTIYYQKVIQMITLLILLLSGATLLFIYFQNKKLNRAYKILLEKNLEIINLQEEPFEKELKKEKKNVLTDSTQEELLNKILTIMKDASVICDSKFSIDRLAELAQSNQNYVSQVININLKKNFRSFLNEYRIREAQRLFTELDPAKYTIDFVASKVGFKSLTGFRNIFKDITGINPSFYFKEVNNKANKMPDNEDALWYFAANSWIW